MKLSVIGANQTQLATSDGVVVLFSYDTPVAALLPSGRYIRTNKKYSNTTTKHINAWLVSVEADLVDQSILDDLVGEV